MSDQGVNVVIGFLGSVLDRGNGPYRWEQWRPTISLFQHPTLSILRFECLIELKHEDLARKIAEDIRCVSPETEVRIHVLPLTDPWDFQDVFGALHGFARRMTFDPGKERYLMHITTGTHVQQICLFLLTESRHFPGALVQTAPPKRENVEDVGRYSIIDLDLSRYDQLAARFEEESREALSFLKAGIATRNPGFNRLMEDIERVAIHSKAPMLLTGPTGSGKSHLARRIHELKRLRHHLKGAFVEVNCATLRGDAARSALFGHVRGAFTGADRSRKGHLLAADGGVLFLDEVAELGGDEQAMLLKAIEEKRFHPVGSDVEVASDFQLIAGTNTDLQIAVRDGRFREDLLARIQLWTFHLPPLRDRLEDVEPNLDYELEQFAQSSGHRAIFSREARRRFLDFAESPEAVWAGNFRDLNAAVCRMATLSGCTGGRITTAVVEAEIARLREQWRLAGSRKLHDRESERDLSMESGSSGDRDGGCSDELLRDLDLFDQIQLKGVLEVCRESRSMSDAGRKLFQMSRGRKAKANDADRLRKYLQRFGLDWNTAKRGEW